MKPLKNFPVHNCGEQHWFALSDPAAKDALYDSAALRRFVGIDLGLTAAPDETKILNFRHLLERRRVPHLSPLMGRNHNRHQPRTSLGTLKNATSAFTRSF